MDLSDKNLKINMFKNIIEKTTENFSRDLESIKESMNILDLKYNMWNSNSNSLDPAEQRKNELEDTSVKTTQIEVQEEIKMENTEKIVKYICGTCWRGLEES